VNKAKMTGIDDESSENDDEIKTVNGEKVLHSDENLSIPV
jgi:hypothetical protein